MSNGVISASAGQKTELMRIGFTPWEACQFSREEARSMLGKINGLSKRKRRYTKKVLFKAEQ